MSVHAESDFASFLQMHFLPWSFFLFKLNYWWYLWHSGGVFQTAFECVGFIFVLSIALCSINAKGIWCLCVKGSQIIIIITMICILTWTISNLQMAFLNIPAGCFSSFTHFNTGRAEREGSKAITWTLLCYFDVYRHKNNWQITKQYLIKS